MKQANYSTVGQKQLRLLKSNNSLILQKVRNIKQETSVLKTVLFLLKESEIFNLIFNHFCTTAMTASVFTEALINRFVSLLPLTLVGLSGKYLSDADSDSDLSIVYFEIQCLVCSTSQLSFVFRCPHVRMSVCPLISIITQFH